MKKLYYHNKIILTANPSFSTKTEETFWNKTEKVAKELGWTVVHASARKIAYAWNRLIIPAKLDDLNGYLPDELLQTDQDTIVIENKQGFLPNWANSEEIELYTDWEYRRWQKKQDKGEIELGLLKLLRYIDLTFKTLKPAICITTNKIDHGTYFYRKAALHFGAHAYVIERSPFDSLWIEEIGIFGESKMHIDYKRNLDKNNNIYYNKIGDLINKRLIANPEGFRRQNQSERDTKKLLAQYNKPLFFLPFDNILWTGFSQPEHPQRRTDYPFYSTPKEALIHLNKTIKEIGGELIVKKHPSCVELKQEDYPDTNFVNGDLRTLFKECDVVVTFLTKLAFNAMAFGKPTVTLAWNPIIASGSTYHVENPEMLADQLLEALNQVGFSEKQNKFKNFIGWAEKEFFIQNQNVPDYTFKSQFTEIPKIIERTKSLKLNCSLSEYNSDIKKIKAIIQDKAIMKNQEDQLPTIDIYYDISRLFLIKAKHSGITRVVVETTKLLVGDARFNIIPIISKNNWFNSQGQEIVYQLTGKYAIDVDTMIHKGISQPSVYFSPYNQLPEKLKGVLPRVLFIHDVIHLRYISLYENNNLLTESIIDSIDHTNDFVFCNSEYTRSEFVRITGFPFNRITIVPLAASSSFYNQIDLKRNETISSLTNVNAKFFVVLAQFDPRKNITTLINTIDQYFTNDPEEQIQCLLLISKTHEEELNTGNLLNSHRFITLTNIDDNKMVSIYSQAQFFLFTPIAEGFGLPVIEAMAAGCPVITSYTTSLMEVGGSAAHYVDPKSPQEILESISLFVKSNEIRETFARRSIERAKSFSWANSTQIMKDKFNLIGHQNISNNDGNIQLTNIIDINTKNNSELIFLINESRVNKTGMLNFKGAQKLFAGKTRVKISRTINSQHDGLLLKLGIEEHSNTSLTSTENLSQDQIMISKQVNYVDYQGNLVLSKLNPIKPLFPKARSFIRRIKNRLIRSFFWGFDIVFPIGSRSRNLLSRIKQYFVSMN